MALAHHGLPLHTRRLDVHAIKRVEEFAGDRGARVRHQIHFQITRRADIPVLRLDRDLMLQQRARTRGAVEPPLDPALALRQPPINLPGTDPPALRLHCRRQCRLMAHG